MSSAPEFDSFTIIAESDKNYDVMPASQCFNIVDTSNLNSGNSFDGLNIELPAQIMALFVSGLYFINCLRLVHMMDCTCDAQK